MPKEKIEIKYAPNTIFISDKGTFRMNASSTGFHTKVEGKDALKKLVFCCDTCREIASSILN